MTNNFIAPEMNPYWLNPIIRIENALVEDVYIENPGTGYIIVSYRMTEKNDNIPNIGPLRLNISKRTKIKNQFGENLKLHDIKRGMRVDAAFSAAITRSIPPQSSAFKIIALTDESSVKTTTDRVIKVDVPGGFLYTGNPFNPLNQMKFAINNATVITDKYGDRIHLHNLRPGQMVRVEHASFQTMSIPPQTTAFRIQVLS
ncbi:MAG: hypothetical protein DBX47_02895 [Clostridiales bacterium]|nr:MAG: hypothetical protein DBX47_02895 [Clostridiales bacterium]